MRRKITMTHQATHITHASTCGLPGSSRTILGATTTRPCPCTALAACVQPQHHQTPDAREALCCSQTLHRPEYALGSEHAAVPCSATCGQTALSECRHNFNFELKFLLYTGLGSTLAHTLHNGNTIHERKHGRRNCQCRKMFMVNMVDKNIKVTYLQLLWC